MSDTADRTTEEGLRLAGDEMSTGFYGLSVAEWAIVLIAVNNVALPSVMPVVIGTLSRDLGFGVARAGYITSISGAAMVLGAICFPFLVLHFKRWVLLTGGILFMVLGFVLTVLSPDYHWLIATRALTGFADGIAAAACYSLMAGSSNPSRLLGMYAAGQGLVGIIGMALLPSVIAVLGWRSLFLFAAIIAIPALLFAPRVGKYHESGALVLRRATFLLPGKALASLGTIFLMFAGLAATWGFMQPIGEARGYGTGMISFAMSLSAAAQLIGSLLVGLVAYRLSIRGAALYGSAAIAIAIAALSFPGYAAFCAAIFALNFAWGFLFPFLFRGLSNSDPTGRAASVTSVVTASAVSIATAVSGALLEELGETSLIVGGGLLAIAGLALASALHGEASEDKA
ncbi:MFS transporter [Sphingopyxis terrae]|uniref:MFS transporter n=1 Tax=Sphingopyxis terrae TaxID=33052 RepID=UPI002A0B463C|nr:MFS transporter [Sphingopyxis terrae]MDX8356500.1 MFS transporter [Sphingopyxis terrae]